jgi:hypothetical protein
VVAHGARGCQVSGNTALTAPAPGVFGSSGATFFGVQASGVGLLDFEDLEVYRATERIKMQFRGEFFNILNHPNFDAFSLNNDLSVPAAVSTAIFTPDLGSASNPVLGAGGSGSRPVRCEGHLVDEGVSSCLCHVMGRYFVIHQLNNEIQTRLAGTLCFTFQ